MYHLNTGLHNTLVRSVFQDISMPFKNTRPVGVLLQKICDIITIVVHLFTYGSYSMALHFVRKIKYTWYENLSLRITANVESSVCASLPNLPVRPYATMQMAKFVGTCSHVLYVNNHPVMFQSKL